MMRKETTCIAMMPTILAAVFFAGCTQLSAAFEATESENAAAKPEPESAVEVTESGNAAAKSEPKSAAVEVTESGNAEALQCGNTLLKACQENRYDLLKEVLAEDLQEDFSAETFSQMLAQLQRTLGTICSFEYLGELKTPQLKTLVWKVRFSRKSSEGREIEQETLLKVLINPIAGKNRVISFNFL